MSWKNLPRFLATLALLACASPLLAQTTAAGGTDFSTLKMGAIAMAIAAKLRAIRDKQPDWDRQQQFSSQ